METPRPALEETITLNQAKKLVQCMAHQQSFMFLSALSGGGRIRPALPLAARHPDRAGGRQRHSAPCRRALGVLPAAGSVTGAARSVLLVLR